MQIYVNNVSRLDLDRVTVTLSHLFGVTAGLVAIHVIYAESCEKDVDAGDKRGHDPREASS